MFSINTNNPMSLCSLEERLKERICIEFREDTGSKWDEYISPNEGEPQNMVSVLDQMGEGVYVGPGTQRILFVAGRANSQKCKGIVGLDINENVKKVNDLNILFFRVSTSREDLYQLARLPVDEADKKSRLIEIDGKIVKDQRIPSFMKDYYRKNLQNFAEFYYGSGINIWTGDQRLYQKELAGDSWEPSFRQVNYFEIDSVFEKIRQYAITGKIVSLVGNINDLFVLNGYPIGVVDVSTIYKYCFIHFRVFNRDESIRGIMTNSGEQAVYESFMYKSLDYVQGMEMNRLHEHLLYKWDKEKWPGELTQLMWNSPWACKYSESHSVLWSSYSQEALMGLREYCEKFLLQIGNCLINTEGEDIKELGEVSLSDLKRVVNDPKLKCCVESLVRYWREIGLKANIVLMEIPGWKEAFEKAVTEKIIKLRDVQNWAEDLGLWKTFIEKFGKQRLENLYRICGLSQWFS